MEKRKILTSLAVLVALTVSGVLFASQNWEMDICKDKAERACIIRMDCSCYFYLQDSGGPARTTDRCWFDDRDFVSIEQ